VDVRVELTCVLVESVKGSKNLTLPLIKGMNSHFKQHGKHIQ
jgi:hypothetical protein